MFNLDNVENSSWTAKEHGPLAHAVDAFYSAVSDDWLDADEELFRGVLPPVIEPVKKSTGSAPRTQNEACPNVQKSKSAEIATLLQPPAENQPRTRETSTSVRHHRRLGASSGLSQGCGKPQRGQVRVHGSMAEQEYDAIQPGEKKTTEEVKNRKGEEEASEYAKYNHFSGGADGPADDKAKQAA
ncbi:hypothetical protein KVR01_011865 [Diaporthe batatas]|uniref:uncharacterized protein n=1 Tax=Diaporthe batatas TaxID=748121 RepID=UPI001D0564CF|nr:uncharacterized protein KVR01_011865 [Diaporthe batatas]KAG8158104.1 hypothetical protein KVR01_011865 [Diaporthe batatas]